MDVEHAPLEGSNQGVGQDAHESGKYDEVGCMAGQRVSERLILAAALGKIRLIEDLHGETCRLGQCHPRGRAAAADDCNDPRRPGFPARGLNDGREIAAAPRYQDDDGLHGAEFSTAPGLLSAGTPPCRL